MDTKYVVIKFGGHTMTDPALRDAFVEDLAPIAAGGRRCVVVHGGGPQISSLLKRLNIPSRFEQGLRVTDEAAMEAVEMALSAQVNKELVGAFTMHGARAVGISGRDGSPLLRAKVRSELLGRVGDVVAVQPDVLSCLVAAGYVPVVSPIAEDVNGGALNLNADTAAGAVAGALKAEFFVLMSDVPGVLDAGKNLLPRLTRAEIEQLKSDGVISGGMIPKVDACLHALDMGCEKALILNGAERSALRRLLEGDTSMGTVVSA
ncbi:MAG: acetylglutamate kinase [Desulfovibrionaceae bacterium]|nr:acetylglutamate kinase [Desulfovibrionaceae bacterium]